LIDSFNQRSTNQQNINMKNLFIATAVLIINNKFCSTKRRLEFKRRKKKRAQGIKSGEIKPREAVAIKTS
jgi:hypothetical protein